jgi:hypothetical protein
MQIKTACVIIGTMFLGCVLFEEVYAHHVKHIRIENTLDPASIAGTYTQAGNWNILHSGGTNYTCASGTTNQYTIGGTPTFESSDQDSDFVRFHNTTITALNDVCGHISFWSHFRPDPSSLVDFDLSSNGQIKNKNGGSSSGSWVHITGWLQHYANGTLPGLADGFTGIWEHIGTTVGPPNYPPVQDKHGSTTGAASFSLTTDENPDLPGINYDRIMKGELWFFLKKDHQLILNNGTGVTVTTSAGGGGGGGGIGVDPCVFFDCELLEQLRDPSAAGRLERIEKHLKLPPFTRPEPVPNPLEEKHMSPEP